MIDQERNNLDIHVTLCEQRYASLESRIDKIEAKLDKIEAKLAEMRLDFFKIMVGTAGTIVVSVIGGVSLVLSKMA